MENFERQDRLPEELYEAILSELTAARHLRTTALVSRLFRKYSNKLLMRHVWVRPWQSGYEVKVGPPISWINNVVLASSLSGRLESS